jgi:hypothetical protein
VNALPLKRLQSLLTPRGTPQEQAIARAQLDRLLTEHQLAVARVEGDEDVTRSDGVGSARIADGPMGQYAGQMPSSKPENRLGLLDLFEENGYARFERFGGQNAQILTVVADEFSVQIYDEHNLRYPDDSDG